MSKRVRLDRIKPLKPFKDKAAYQKALQIDPKNSQAALGLAWAQLTAQQYDQAIAAFSKAMELEKGNAVVALNGMGWAHYFKKDMEKAEALFKQASAAGEWPSCASRCRSSFTSAGRARR